MEVNVLMAAWRARLLQLENAKVRTTVVGQQLILLGCHTLLELVIRRLSSKLSLKINTDKYSWQYLSVPFNVDRSMYYLTPSTVVKFKG